MHCELIFEMEMEDYLKKTNYLSGSSLNLLLSRPDKYKHTHIDGNESENSDPMKIGSLTHTFFMEPHKFESEYHVIPEFYENKSGKTCIWRDNENNPSYLKDIEKAGSKTRVKKKQIEEAKLYASALLEDEFARNSLINAHIESTFLCEMNNGIKIKSRPDIMNENSGVCYNIKTTSSIAPDEFYRSALYFGYDISAALTAYCYEKFFGVKLKDYVFICVEKSKTMPVVSFNSNDPMYGEGSMTFLQFGAIRLKKALDKYISCKKKNFWPALDNMKQPMKVPYWALKEYLEYE